MCGVKNKTYKPNAENQKVYQQIYALYKQLHDAFGVKSSTAQLSNVMKDLLAIKDKAS